MALLAEQKRKAKFGLDPRNTSWSNDTSKFGQRLMEKMGWEQGKGLGANEDGIKEHIKASYKSDTKGLGCTPQAADSWIAHQEDFNDLLKKLNSQSEASSQEESTEKTKSVDGHKRYYGRFARGQVQTLRSTEDLDCIFGRRKATSEVPKPNEQLTASSDSDDTGEQSEHGLTTVTSTSSVQEYFAKKMAEMKARKEANSGQKSALVSSEETSEEKAAESTDSEHKKETKSPYGTVSFSYNNEKQIDSSPADANETATVLPYRDWYQNFAEDSCSNVQNTVAAEKSLKKKKRKKEKGDHEVNDCNIEVVTLDVKKGKVKRESKHKTELEDESLELPPVSKNEGKKSKKTKSKEKTTSPADANETATVLPYRDWYQNFAEDSCSNVQNTVAEEKLEDESLELPPVSKNEGKTSKKTKSKEKTTTETLSSDNQIYTPVSDEGSGSKKKKKSKRSKTDYDKGIRVDDNLDSDVAHTGVICEKIKKKRKKFENDNVDESRVAHLTEEPVTDNTRTEYGKGQGKNTSDCADDVTSGSEEHKKTKKRKHSEIGIDAESGSTLCTVNCDDSSDVKSKKKKKRRQESDTIEPEEDKGDNINSVQKDENTLVDEHDITRDDATHPPRSSEHDRKLKKRDRKKRRKMKEAKLKEKQTAKSNALFPGSNIAEIVGYGFRNSQAENRLKKKTSK